MGLTVPFHDVAARIAARREALDTAIAAVLDDGRLILGPAVERFEAAWAAYCGAGHAVGVGSGTDAIELALRALGVGPGDEVITAANTCVPTVAGIVAAGATPVLADVDEATFTLDPARAEAAVTDRTRAIVAVHLYGQPADMGALAEIAAARDLVVVEDAAQAHGACLRGRRAGTLADAAAFSFYPTKNLGALGDAGAVVTNDEVVAERVRALRVYGERAGNSRLDTLQAAVLEAQLSELDGWNERRRALAGRYLAALEGADVVLPAVREHAEHVFHLFVVRSAERDALRARLEAAGVGTAVHYDRAVHEHPAYRELGAGRDLGISERLAREVVSLPLQPELRDDQVDLVAASV